MSQTEVEFWNQYADGSPRNYVHEVRTMRSIRKIVLKGPVDLYFRRSDTPLLVVAGDTEKAISKVHTRFDGDKLVIENEGGCVTIIHGQGIFVDGQRVSGPSVNTGGHAVVGITLPELPCVKIRGSGDISLLDLQQEVLEIEIAGSGDVTATGQVEMLKVKIAGSGDVAARGLIARRGSLSVAGSGDISCYITEVVDARVAGSGEIRVRGEPPVRNVQAIGGGNVKFK